MPIDFGWTSQTSALQLDLLAYSLPRAVAAGVLVAMIVAVLLTTLGSVVAAWGTALVAMLVLVVNHTVGHTAAVGDSLATMNFIDSLSGGAAMGALGAAVLHHRLPAYGWTLGALTSLLLGSVNPLPTVGDLLGGYSDSWRAADMPPMWMLWLAVILVGVGVLLNRNRRPAARPSIELPLTPILAGVVVVLVTLVSAEWLARHGDSFAGVGLAVVTAVTTALIAAMLLPRRDGELVLVAVAISAVGSASIAAELPAWSIPLMVAVAAAGMWYGERRPAPMACVLLLVVLGVLTALTAESDWAAVVVGGGALLAWLAGYGLMAARPRYVPSRVLGTMLLFVPSAVLGLRDYVARGHYAMQDGNTAIVCTVTTHDTSAPAWTAVFIALGCAAGLYILRRSRPAKPVKPVADPETPAGE